jgi:exodeoxyribonuclease VII small subunit
MEQTFEGALERLAAVVGALENDGTSLADAMALYEEGITLAQSCRRQLEEAELKITELRARTEGGFSEEEIDI